MISENSWLTTAELAKRLEKSKRTVRRSVADRWHIPFTRVVSVTIRGRRYELGTDTVTGATKILATADMPEVPGVTVELEFQKPAFSDADYNFARQAITITRHGDVYDGSSMPSWYGETGLEMVLAAAPKDLTLRRFSATFSAQCRPRTCR